jgi:hypothetical protein
MYWQWKSFDDHSFPYLNGNSFAVQCRHIWNYDGYKINPKAKHDNWVFVKTDYISNFFSNVNLHHPFVMFTHNSDYSINENHLKFLDDPRIIAWFAQNVAIKHPKLKPIPIGIAPAGYAHGDISAINKIRDEQNIKTKMFYANYSIQNNRAEREYCLQQTGIPLESDINGGWNGFAGGYKLPTTFEGYLRDLSKSYFSISPKGNGIDCHRTWESLYVGTIPIVSRSEVTDAHKDMPIIILDDWADFKKISFDENLYHKVWNNFNIGDLHMDNYLKRIMKEIPQ